MLTPPYPATFRLGDGTPTPVVNDSHLHIEPWIIIGAGGLTITGLVLQAKGAKDMGTLCYVSAILASTIFTALRCYR